MNSPPSGPVSHIWKRIGMRLCSTASPSKTPHPTPLMDAAVGRVSGMRTSLWMVGIYAAIRLGVDFAQFASNTLYLRNPSELYRDADGIMKTEPSKRQRLMERILGTTVEFALRGPIAPHLIQEAKIMPIILDSMSNSSQHNQVQFGLHKIMADPYVAAEAINSGIMTVVCENMIRKSTWPKFEGRSMESIVLRNLLSTKQGADALMSNKHFGLAFDCILTEGQRRPETASFVLSSLAYYCPQKLSPDNKARMQAFFEKMMQGPRDATYKLAWNGLSSLGAAKEPFPIKEPRAIVDPSILNTPINPYIRLALPLYASIRWAWIANRAGLTPFAFKSFFSTVVNRTVVSVAAAYAYLLVQESTEMVHASMARHFTRENFSWEDRLAWHSTLSVANSLLSIGLMWRFPFAIVPELIVELAEKKVFDFFHEYRIKEEMYHDQAHKNIMKTVLQKPKTKELASSTH